MTNDNDNDNIQLGKFFKNLKFFFCDNCGMKVLPADSFIYGELPCDIDSANAGESAVVCHACDEKIEAGTLITNKKENQMIDPVDAARREYDNADEAFRSNPTDANLASYEIARKAFLLVAPVVAGVSSNAAVDEDQDERPFPDSDEAIRALQDVAEAVNELEAECYRLRAKLKTSNAERDELRQQVENIKNGFEGSCYACEPVGEMNKKLLKERDEARREVCEFEKYCLEEAAKRGWDCFKIEKAL
jgi:predicted RNase H-like nuclease (RuvC/YqgF family)